MDPLTIGLLGTSLLGGLFGGGGRSQRTTSTIDPALAPLRDNLLSTLMGRMNSPLPPGYENLGIAGINDTYRLGRGALQNRLTSAGLGGSPVAGSGMSALEGARIGDVSRFRAGVPLVEREQQDNALRMALGLLGTGSQSTTEASGGVGSAIAGGLGDAAGMLGWLIGSGRVGGGGARGAGRGGPSPWVTDLGPLVSDRGNLWG